MEKIELYGKVRIEIYEQIAEYIRHLNMADLKSIDDVQFDENCLELYNMLKKDGIEIGIEERFAKHFWHIGLNTLLQSIYNIKSEENRIDVFSKQIATLKDIGVKNISFLGESVYEIGTLGGISISHDYKNHKEVILEKTYTDGYFGIENEGGYSHIFRLTNLEKMNYLIHTTLMSKNGDGSNITGELIGADATLYNFTGIYPEKEEILKMCFPMIEVDRMAHKWQTTEERVKMLLK